MSDPINDGGPAFPPVHDPKSHESGMTLRDYFAGQALAGLVGGYLCNREMVGLSRAHWADEAYIYADAMLKRRGQ